MKHSGIVDRLRSQIPAPQRLWKYIAVEVDPDSPTGYRDLFTKEPIDPQEYDHTTVVEWVQPNTQTGSNT